MGLHVLVVAGQHGEDPLVRLLAEAGVDVGLAVEPRAVAVLVRQAVLHLADLGDHLDAAAVRAHAGKALRVGLQ